MSWPWISTLCALLVLNTVASVRVLRNPAVSTTQHIFQLVLVWLLPVVGAVVCLVFLQAESPSSATSLNQDAFGGVDPGGGEWDIPPGGSICGCGGAGSGGVADGDGD